VLWGAAQSHVTDADLVLGYLDPDNFLGGGMTLDRAAAEAALEPCRGRLGHLAHGGGGRDPADPGLADADLVRRTTIERGYDPTRLTLLAYGGMGPTHALATPQISVLPRS